MAKKATAAKKPRIVRTEIYLPPSGATQWADCTEQPWFVLANQHRIKDDNGTEASAEGVLAHALGQSMLLGTVEPDGDITEDMREKVGGYVEYCQSLPTLHPQGFTVDVELKVPPFYAPHRNAYLDYVKVSSNKAKTVTEVNIVDLKYGKWIVEAEANKQLAIYARSLHEKRKLPVEGTIWHLHIYQPHSNRAVPYSVWTMTAADMIAWTDLSIGDVVEDIRAKRGLVFAPSDDRCHFCPASTICPARGRDLFSARDSVSTLTNFQPMVEIVEASDLPKEKILAMLPHTDALIKFLGDVKELARQYGERGIVTEDDGYKMVAGRNSRKWTSEDDARDMLSMMFEPDDIEKRKLISPAQAEELFKKNKIKKAKDQLDPFVTKSPGRHLLVPASDKREAVTGKFLEEGDADALLDAHNFS